MTWEELDDLARSLGWDDYQDADTAIAAKFGFATLDDLADAINGDPDVAESDYLDQMSAEELEIWNAET